MLFVNVDEIDPWDSNFMTFFVGEWIACVGRFIFSYLYQDGVHYWYYIRVVLGLSDDDLEAAAKGGVLPTDEVEEEPKEGDDFPNDFLL